MQGISFKTVSSESTQSKENGIAASICFKSCAMIISRSDSILPTCSTHDRTRMESWIMETFNYIEEASTAISELNFIQIFRPRTHFDRTHEMFYAQNPKNLRVLKCSTRRTPRFLGLYYFQCLEPQDSQGCVIFYVLSKWIFCLIYSWLIWYLYVFV